MGSESRGDIFEPFHSSEASGVASLERGQAEMGDASDVTHDGMYKDRPRPRLDMGKSSAVRNDSNFILKKCLTRGRCIGQTRQRNASFHILDAFLKGLIRSGNQNCTS